MADHSSMLIADDHEVFRYGLAEVARRKLGLATVLEAASFEEALSHLSDPTVRLAILDLSMPGLGSPAELIRVRRSRPDVCLIVLSGSAAREDILSALAAGVHGYIVKSTRTDQLVQTIKTVMAGTIYVPPSLAVLPPEPVATVSMQASRPTAASGMPLTDRQREILRLVAEGRSNKEIALVLDIAEGTVKMHVTSILRVTGARNRAQAAAIGRQLLAL
ncbi:MAG: response regulator transcription factor [Hyphomicrobiaceae bacterium]|nr:response regulator transcription factor [Hyphomicrobiaceae bacterium]